MRENEVLLFIPKREKEEKMGLEKNIKKQYVINFPSLNSILFFSDCEKK